MVETAEPPSQNCRSHSPISPIDGWLVFAREIAGIACWSSPLAISGIAIPGMAMPSMLMPPGAEPLVSVCCEWQSAFLEGNAQERSQAAANADTESSSATIEPANMRLIIMPESIL